MPHAFTQSNLEADSLLPILAGLAREEAVGAAVVRLLPAWYHTDHQVMLHSDPRVAVTGPR